MKFPDFQLTDKNIFFAGAITMYAYPIVGWSILTLFAKENENFFFELLLHGLPQVYQILIGLVYGVGAYFIVQVFIFSGFLQDFTKPIVKIAKRLNWIQVIFLSLAAGFGEEVLFRVGIQHFFGIWPTAIIFVAIHGYLNVFNPRIFLYGLVMVFISAGFGYLYVAYGITSAVIAHFVIDLLIFGVLKLWPEEQLIESKDQNN